MLQINNSRASPVVLLQDLGVVADALDEEVLILAVEGVDQDAPPLLRCVGGIKNGYLR